MSCRFSLLTAAGRSAVASIGVEGPAAAELLSRFFQPRHARSDLRRLKPGQLRVGLWGDEDASEELVLARGDGNRWEIHCHGGLAAVERITADLQSAGATSVDATAWIGAESADPISRAAMQALPAAPTVRTAGVLLDQYRGALREALQALLRDMQSSAAGEAREKLERLLALAPAGLHLTQPWRIALIGPPNAGKSSLMNRILGYERSIVYDLPGTTRDVLRAGTAVNGWPIEFADTAGLRDAAQDLEAAGIARARGLLSEIDLAIFVNEVLNDGPLRELSADFAIPPLMVLNKIDRLTSCCQVRGEWLPVSALTGQGVEELLEAIEQRLVPVAPRAGEAVPFTPAQVQALERAARALRGGDLDMARRLIAELLK